MESVLHHNSENLYWLSKKHLTSHLVISGYKSLHAQKQGLLVLVELFCSSVDEVMCLTALLL